MNLWHIALYNSRRRWGRSAMMMLGIALAVGLGICVQEIGQRMQHQIGEQLDTYGANILIAPQSESLQLSYGGIQLGSARASSTNLELGSLDAIAQIPDANSIQAVAPKVFGILQTSRGPAVGIGVDFAQELRIKRWWQLDGTAPSAPDQIIVGARIAEEHQWSPGDHIQIEGDSWQISAVLEPNASDDDRALFLPIERMRQYLPDQPGFHLIEISALCSECPIDEMVAQLEHQLPDSRITPVRQAIALRMETMEQLMHFSRLLLGAVVGAALMMVGSIMLSSVQERTGEIGLMRALGFRRRHILTCIWIEVAWLSSLACLLGIIAGTLATHIIGQRLLENSPPLLQSLPSGTSLLIALGLSMGLGLVGSFSPARRAAALEPLDALRAI